MSVEIAWKQNILVTDSYLLKLLLVVCGLGLQAFVCDFSRQNICSVHHFFKGNSSDSLWIQASFEADCKKKQVDQNEPVLILHFFRIGFFVYS